LDVERQKRRPYKNTVTICALGFWDFQDNEDITVIIIDKNFRIKAYQKLSKIIKNQRKFRHSPDMKTAGKRVDKVFCKCKNKRRFLNMQIA